MCRRDSPYDIPAMESLGLPPAAFTFPKLNRGFVLVTGPTGHGKSTTLASIVERINQERQAHIVTLEDPIEYLFQHKQSIVVQLSLIHISEPTRLGMISYAVFCLKKKKKKKHNKK